ncbi:hypothetical protein [Leifsonia poae]|uniref:hypothetical protein n=1 Tax=Leifsonia poae TaxID=110933 RepID=UPI003D67F37C
MSESDPRRDGDEDLDAFVEAKAADYEPAPQIRDEDDLPTNPDELDEDDGTVPDEDRPVPLDPDDAEIA